LNNVEKDAPTFVLTAKSGLTRGVSWDLAEHPLTIGRGDTCDIVVADPVVSRRHCEVTLVGQHVQLRDLGSSNSTLVNGEAIAECLLVPGDVLSVGNATFVFAEKHADSTPKPKAAVGHPTKTLSIGEALFLSKIDEDMAEGRRKTVADLASLFRTSRDFSRASSLQNLESALWSAIRERYEPNRAWLIIERWGRQETISYNADPHETVNPPEKVLNLVRKDRRGVLSAEQVQVGAAKVVESTLSAPILIGNRAIGALCLVQTTPRGAYDEEDLEYLVALAYTVAPYFRAIEQQEVLERENFRLRSAEQNLPAFVGNSKPMRRLRQRILAAAQANQPVLITGETGAGKELVAERIHELSDRNRGPFIVVNCAAIPRELFESEFFGYEKGAFTGAAKRKLGFIEQSHGGTLFLDEIGDLGLDNQGRILRAIETGRFRRVGGTEEIDIDLRVVSATNRDLEARIPEGLFRTDLYHRLNGIALRVPPLRERKSDIPTLVEYFLRGIASQEGKKNLALTKDALKTLAHHKWPGNVRELKRCIEAATAFATESTIGPAEVMACLTSEPLDRAPRPLEEIEKEHIRRALDYCGGRVDDAAELLGIARSTLYYKKSQYGL